MKEKIKNFKKPLDKLKNLCYNKHVIKGSRTPQTEKASDTMTTNTNPKTTNKTALLYAIDHLTNAPADVIEKLQNMVAQLEKKNASPRKMTAQQEKNEGLKAEILDFLSDHEGEGFTVTDLTKAVPSLEGDSNQHVSALVRALVEAKAIEKYSEKRRTYFRFVG